MHLTPNLHVDRDSPFGSSTIVDTDVTRVPTGSPRRKQTLPSNLPNHHPTAHHIGVLAVETFRNEGDEVLWLSSLNYIRVPPTSVVLLLLVVKNLQEKKRSSSSLRTCIYC